MGKMKARWKYRDFARWFWTCPLEMVAKAFNALDSAFPFGLDFGVSTRVELVEPVVKNVKYRKLFKFPKGK